MKSLAAANVETVIVFRTLTPLAVALLDSMFLGRELPSARAWCGLALITGGAVAYASFDDAFRRLGARAYRYPALYAGVIAVEMTYGKHIVHGTSAATYTVVGVMNKCVTVLANALIWRRHANVRGILSLCVCLLGGVVYEQAPLRDPARPKLKIALCGAWLGAA
ncbi:nucleotide-sugar transmembrane transporter [Aureococcus anophagefferens]|nr:nucleotide-sugar transmembrane transporter [Aureococcus anophagefferens]